MKANTFKQHHKVHVFKYGFSGSSSMENYHSKFMPDIAEEVLGPYVQKAVSGPWKSVEVPQEVSGTLTDGVYNRQEIIEAVTALATATARSQWEHGARTLTIGGDHSQGFATIKATLLVAVTRAILCDGNIPVDQIFKYELWTLAEAGKWTEIANVIDRLAKDGKPVRDGIKDVINGINILWVDAHGDFNTSETSTSHNFHGMSLAAACGLHAGGIEQVFGSFIHANPENVHVICARDLDSKERSLMRKKGVKFIPYEMEEPLRSKIRAYGIREGQRFKELAEGWLNFRQVEREVRQDSFELYPEGRRRDRSLKEIIEEIFEKFPQRKFIVSVDMDHMHGAYVSTTGTPMGLPLDLRTRAVRLNRKKQSPPGPRLADSVLAFRGLMQTERLLAADLTEGSPAAGKKGKAIFDNLVTANSTIHMLMGMLHIGAFREWYFISQIGIWGRVLENACWPLVAGEHQGRRPKVTPPAPMRLRIRATVGKLIPH